MEDQKKSRAKPRPMPIDPSSPWWNLAKGAAYENRAKRWLAREADAGRVRHAVIGGRKEKFFRKEWLDEHIESMTVPVVLNVRRRA
jgi:hypothetical protein